MSADNTVPDLENHSVMRKLTENILNKNIKKHICTISNRFDITSLLCKESNNDNYLRLDLHKTALRDKHISSIKLIFQYKNDNNDPTIAFKTPNKYLLNTKYKIMSDYNLIFEGNYKMGGDLLTEGIILPVKYLNNICINIINIDKIIPIVNDLELVSFTSLAEYENEFDESIPKILIDQLIVNKDNTYNVLRIIFGMATKLIGDGDVSFHKFNEIAHKISYKMLEF